MNAFKQPEGPTFCLCQKFHMIFFCLAIIITRYKDILNAFHLMMVEKENQKVHHLMPEYGNISTMCKLMINGYHENAYALSDTKYYRSPLGISNANRIQIAFCSTHLICLSFCWIRNFFFSYPAAHLFT